MSLRVDKRSLLDLNQKNTLGQLDFDAGGIQRKEVFKPKEKAFLIDSVARHLPIGALTIFVGEGDMDDTEAIWEVIDGKQRMTTILAYISGDLIPTSDHIQEMRDKLESELPPPPESELADAIPDRRFTDLSPEQKAKLMGFVVPIYLINGERQEAVRVFARMNHVSYVLKPQEMRNAIFRNSPVLEKARLVADVLNGDTEESETSDLVAMAVISKTKYDRMSDVEFASELLYLSFNNNQAMHRRDKLDQFYQDLMSPDELNSRKLDEATNLLTDIVPYVKSVFNTTSLRGFHFRSPENDFYAVIGAFLVHGLPNETQRVDRREELQQEIKQFYRAVRKSIEEINDGAEKYSYPDDDDVMTYSRTYLSGQQNSNTRRNERVACIARILTRVFDDVDHPFTAYQREVIWANSIDKTCARCGQIVEFEDYEAGHLDSRAGGGRSTIDNGQVEHRSCNRSAGTS